VVHVPLDKICRSIKTPLQDPQKHQLKVKTNKQKEGWRIWCYLTWSYRCSICWACCKTCVAIKWFNADISTIFVSVSWTVSRRLDNSTYKKRIIGKGIVMRNQTSNNKNKLYSNSKGINFYHLKGTCFIIQELLLDS
jgi:hypothetical protein